jgi:pimeloyl-ACP methyl ester carboxylesterase
MLLAVEIIISMALLVLSGGAIFEFLSRRKLNRGITKGRTFVNINGVPIHYVRRGKGNCTVIFASGLGSNHLIWRDIQNSISVTAVTLSYDRSGLLYSADNGLSVTNHLISEELELLLEVTNCPKPYLLIAHSMAGIYMRPFIQRNQNSIAAMLFVEAAHPLQMKMASAKLLKAISAPPHWFIRFAVNWGIYRILFLFMRLSPELPVNHWLHRAEKDFFYKSYQKLLEEIDNDHLNFADAEKYTSFGDIPLTVIMGTSTIRYQNIKNGAVKNEFMLLVNEVQRDLLNLSTNSRLIKATRSGHIPQITDQALLESEIRKLLTGFK